MRQRITGLGLVAFCLLMAFPIRAAELKPETVKAWDSYIESVQTRMRARLAPGQSFLWADENLSRSQRLRLGEVQVVPVDGHGSQPAPSGLIHDWVGAVFIPNASLGDLTSLSRDYAHYKDIYQPLVVDSREIDKSEEADHFSMRWMYKALFVTTALETDYCSHSVKVSDKKFYSVLRTTRVQEIQDYGTAAEHSLPAGQGSGFIWKLFSVTRYEERDGGVYVEIEAVVLTRDIPPSVRFLVKPIVAKLSRNSLLVSLAQTREAVQSRQSKSYPPLQITQKSGTEPPGPRPVQPSAASFVPR